jgi:hypothetical protein
MKPAVVRGVPWFAILLAGVVLGLCAKFLYSSKAPADKAAPAGTVSGTSAGSPVPGEVGITRRQSDNSNGASEPVHEDRDALLKTFNALFENHVAQLRATDEQNFSYMMTKPDDRFLTKSIAKYAWDAKQFPPPQLESLLGIGFAGEVEMAGIIHRQAMLLERISLGETSVTSIVLPEDETLFEYPLEAIVGSLLGKSDAALSPKTILNLAAIRDVYLSQFGPANEEEWFVLSAVRKSYIVLGYPINYDQDDLCDLFPPLAGLRAEKRALAYQYLESLRHELGLPR